MYELNDETLLLEIAIFKLKNTKKRTSITNDVIGQIWESIHLSEYAHLINPKQLQWLRYVYSDVKNELVNLKESNWTKREDSPINFLFHHFIDENEKDDEYNIEITKLVLFFIIIRILSHGTKEAETTINEDFSKVLAKTYPQIFQFLRDFERKYQLQSRTKTIPLIQKINYCTTLLPLINLLCPKDFKSESERKKEEKKLKKLEKFMAKKAKEQKQQPTSSSKPKKEKKEEKKVVEYVLETGKGEKKNIEIPLPEVYSPKYVESIWYNWWEKEGFFQPEILSRFPQKRMKSDESFTIVMPPPNITGSLHLGHALTCSVQDALCRWHRMSGRNVLWNPGTDHAGIATQVVVEKRLLREENKSRHEIGRQKFVEKVWEWKKEKGSFISDQLRRLGTSCDWSREYFSLDDNMCRAVNEAFKRLFEKKIIYRANRLVNWSCSLRSAISNIEVEKKEISGRTFLPVPGYDEKVEFGVLISFAYKISHDDDVDTNEEIIVATTRIETMLGDTGIAVHPEDDRYKKFIGKKVKHPLIDNRILTIVADTFVDQNFGSGAVKITPAHDPNDFDCGKRHDLPFINILNNDGTFNKNCGRFEGMKRFEGRIKVLEELKALNLYRETVDNEMVIPICSRSKDIIEPIIKPQWYVKCKEMADRAVKHMENEDLLILPEQHRNTWKYWLIDCQDWCISRQLWWGHQIPAYRLLSIDKKDCLEDVQEYWTVAEDEAEAEKSFQERLNLSEKNHLEIVRDSDVLDTWFSSALFPFSIFSWPQKTKELERFYPGTLLETGLDILFFWVARMVMMGLELTDTLPFKTIFLHAMVRDAHGRKMSKSLGNVVDPLNVIEGISLKQLQDLLKSNSNLNKNEIKKALDGQSKDYPSGIPECGTDALRFALCSYTSQGRDINLDVLRVRGFRFFCNKIWNATRFILYHQNISDKDVFMPSTTFQLNGTEGKLEKWLLYRLKKTIVKCNESFEKYDFNTATTSIYNIWLYDFCDVYIEYAKGKLSNKEVDDKTKDMIRQHLYTIVEIVLRLISPFMPFISEELWQRLPKRSPDELSSIMIADYPNLKQDFGEEVLETNDVIENDFNFIYEIVKSIRSIRSEYQIKAKTKIYLKLIDENDKETMELLQDKNYQYLIEVLGISELDGVSTRIDDDIKRYSSTKLLQNRCEIFIYLKDYIDVNKEMLRTKEKIMSLETNFNELKTNMDKSDYTTVVPENIRIKNLEKINRLKDELEKENETLNTLQQMSK
ncbi:hypothetical protein SNEBB_009445 [Seison nebaliae]|nr:hypothetical protein SNEBB_009445 [Seison nebaliae]